MKELVEKIISENFIESNDLTIQIIKEKTARGMRDKKSKVMDKERQDVEGSQSHTPKPYYK